MVRWRLFSPILLLHMNFHSCAVGRLVDHQVLRHQAILSRQVCAPSRQSKTTNLGQLVETLFECELSSLMKSSTLQVCPQL